MTAEAAGTDVALAARWPRIASELGRARREEARSWLAAVQGEGEGGGPALADLAPAELLATTRRALRHVAGLAYVLDTVERALTGAAPRPRTLSEALAPVRAHLLWAFDTDEPFSGASVFEGEAGRPDGSSVRFRVELQALEPESG
ncbi:hypothetical protein [Kitasatospora sp. NPDC050543]|uniref:hypothetical protein n=1 Tax=Kitasatospora sp. NPDC050543 TaxID=3364054 RepID=UPI0037AC2B3B